eukprot:TRINITY_DN6912_c3_g1_i1.p1 TRINITY_DN6912_c3_g1~~TRINITY_DN6912_c3_g1_i1.p1  ORF type:complete len:863 (+),score=203.55 TRINITY_DN6912_c3_g1_i1:123-2711(+)
MSLPTIYLVVCCCLCWAGYATAAEKALPLERTTSVILTAAGDQELAVPQILPQLLEVYPPEAMSEEVRDPYAPASATHDAPATHHAEAPRRHRHSHHSRGRFPVESDDDPGADSQSQDEEPTPSPAPPSKAVYVQQEIRQAVNGSTPAGWIELGSPKKKLYVIMDTGSDKLVAKTWDTIRRMLKMVDGGIDSSVSPSSTVYDHGQSATYVRQVTDRKAPDGSSTGTHMQKRGYIAYGSGVAITDEGNDDVHVGGNTLPQFPLSEILADSLQMLHTKQGIAGILGLQHMKNTTLGESVFTRARQNGGFTSFGYCRGNNNDGTFIWGDKSTEGQEVPVVGNIHWALKLGHVKMIGQSGASSTSTTTQAPDSSDSSNDQSSEDGSGSSGGGESSDDSMEPMRRPRLGVHLGGRRGFQSLHKSHAAPANLLAVESRQAPGDEGGSGGSENAETSGVDPELKDEIGKMVGDVIDKVIDKITHNKVKQMSKTMCEDGKCAAIIDTGSNIIAGPSEALREMAKYANVKYDCSNLDKLPHIHLQLGDFKAELPPKAYVMQVTLPKWAQQGRGDGADGGGEAGGAEDAGAGDGEGGGGADGMNRAMSRRGRHLHVSMPGGKTITTKLNQEATWDSVIRELHRTSGVDLSAALPGINLAKLQGNDKLCMPAFAPLDKETAVGKLWVIGTPIFEQYYTRWSFPKDAAMPSVFFADKNVASACQAGASDGAAATDASGSSSSDASTDGSTEGSSGGSGSGDSSSSESSEPTAEDSDFQANEKHSRKLTKPAAATQVLNSVRSALAGVQHIGPGLLRREVKGDAASIQLLDEGSLEAEVGSSETTSKLVGTSFMPRRMDAFEIRYPSWAKELSEV